MILFHRSSKWSPEAIDDFESLTHTGNPKPNSNKLFFELVIANIFKIYFLLGEWKPLLASVVNFDPVAFSDDKSEIKTRAQLKIIDANSEKVNYHFNIKGKFTV